MICESGGQIERGAEIGEFLFKTLGLGDSGDGTDVFSGKPGKGEFFTSVQVLQMKGLVSALDDARGGVVLADSMDEGCVVSPFAFSDENVLSAPQVFGGFAKGSSREEIFVSKGGLTVDEAEVNALMEGQVLHAVIEDEGVAGKLLNGLDGGPHAVPVYEDNDVAKGTGEHEGFVACEAAVQEEADAVMHDAGFVLHQAQPFALKPSEEGGLLCLVTSGKDRHTPTLILECAREEFYNRRFAGTADGQVPDGNNEASWTSGSEEALSIEPEPRLNEYAKQAAEKP